MVPRRFSSWTLCSRMSFSRARSTNRRTSDSASSAAASAALSCASDSSSWVFLASSSLREVRRSRWACCSCNSVCWLCVWSCSTCDLSWSSSSLFAPGGESRAMASCACSSRTSSPRASSSSCDCLRERSRSSMRAAWVVVATLAASLAAVSPSFSLLTSITADSSCDSASCCCRHAARSRSSASLSALAWSCAAPSSALNAAPSSCLRAGTG
mmetsp:Transcript_10696/g.30089  ORF Transcript_10696/g.30089 Transcript_10696/m.30089 type:complete len:213 (+) Transcript_10696:277-915(+)